MNADEFEEVFEEQVQRCRAVLIQKAKEYADDSDRLRNFKKAAALNEQTEEQALWGYQTKHLISLADMIASGDYYPPAVWNEKLGDALNFLFLLRAVVIEKDQTSQGDDSVNVPESQAGTNHGTPVVTLFRGIPQEPDPDIAVDDED